MEVSTNPEHIEGDPLDGGHGDEDVGRLRGVDQPIANHHHLQSWFVFEIHSFHLHLPGRLRYMKVMLLIMMVIRVKWPPLEGDIQRQHS